MAYKWDNEAWKMITCWDERGTQDGFFFWNYSTHNTLVCKCLGNMESESVGKTYQD